MNSFAASPEFAPDTLFLYLEPDLVVTIMHSILEAVEIHNSELERQARQEKHGEKNYTAEELEAYEATYGTYVEAQAWQKDAASRTSPRTLIMTRYTHQRSEFTVASTRPTLQDSSPVSL